MQPARRRRQTTKVQLPVIPRKVWSLLAVVALLLVIGVIAVYEASAVEAVEQFSSRFHFARLQLGWVVVGMTCLVGMIFVPIETLKKMAVPAFIFTLFLLLIVLIPGIGTKVGGARRWISLGGLNIQPSELVKLSLVIYLAAFFEKKIRYQQFLVTLGLVVGLIMLQPDLGTALVVIACSLSVFFVAGASWQAITAIVGVGIAGILVLVATSSYRMARLLTFLNPERDPTGASYHIRQVLIALGTGGVWGLGIGKSIQKFSYLPESRTDSIFAIFAEETGLVGSLLLLALFVYIAYKGFWLATKVEDRFCQLLAVGATSLIVVQAFLNLGAMTAIVPLTGIPLPYISYGGSSLVVTLMATGLLINISRHTSK